MMHWQVHDENKDSAFLLITGKHEEKADEHGFVSRQFTRRYALPKDVDIKELQCNLSNQGLSARVFFVPPTPIPLAGILTLQAPRKQLTVTANNTRAIPITHVATAPKLTDKKPVETKPAAKNGH